MKFYQYKFSAFLLFFVLIFAVRASAVKEVHFYPANGGETYANLYGEGKHAVVLAHGAIFNKESWNAHAQHIFKTKQAKQLMQVILEFLQSEEKSQ